MAAITAVALGCPRLASARTWYVYANGSGDAPFIQAAVDSAQDGDVILVGPGSYPEPFVDIRKSLELASIGGPGVTRIRQLSLFEPPRTGFHSMSARGFTIEGGEIVGGGFTAFNVGSIELVNCIVRGFAYHSEVRSVRDVLISECTFVDNSALVTDDIGGGALLVVSLTNSPPARISNCLFLRNRCPHGNPGEGWNGGGALAVESEVNSSVVVSGCVFDGNEAPTAGAVFGLSCAILHHNTFINNRSQDGAVVVDTYCETAYNLFVNNEPRGLYKLGVVPCQCNAYWENSHSGDLCIDDFLDVDPLLCDPEHGDYHLGKGSLLEGPFTDGIHDACEGPIGAFGVGCDPIPVVETSWGVIKARYATADK